jgi:hypothetical protein
MARRKIDLERLPSNNQMTSNRKAIIKGGVKTRPIGGVANKVRDIGNSLFEEIILPSLKSSVIDFFGEGIRMVINGRPDYRRTRRPDHQSYNNMYRQRRRPAQDRRRSSRKRPQQSEAVYEDIYFDRRDDAELVLGRMMELIAEYSWATIGDLYSTVGITSNYTHERYGWDNLQGVRVIYTTEGYVIDLPEPEYLK